MNDLKSYALGSHAWFYPEGKAFTSPTAGTCAVDALPDKDETTWASLFLGDCEEWADKKTVDSEDVFKPNPGVLVRKDIVTHFQSLDIELTTNSLRRIAMQIMYGSAVELTTGVGQFTPLASPPPNGWLKIQRYTQENELVFAADLWVRLDVTDTASGNKKLVKPKFSAKLLASDLNTMFFGDSSLLA